LAISLRDDNGKRRISPYNPDFFCQSVHVRSHGNSVALDTRYIHCVSSLHFVVGCRDYDGLSGRLLAQVIAGEKGTHTSISTYLFQKRCASPFIWAVARSPVASCDRREARHLRLHAGSEAPGSAHAAAKFFPRRRLRSGRSSRHHRSRREKRRQCGQDDCEWRDVMVRDTMRLIMWQSIY
jgi:hypothetical protein